MCGMQAHEDNHVYRWPGMRAHRQTNAILPGTVGSALRLNAAMRSLEENAEVGNHLEEPLFYDAHLILASAPNAAMGTPHTHHVWLSRLKIGLPATWG